MQKDVKILLTEDGYNKVSKDKNAILNETTTWPVHESSLVKLATEMAMNFNESWNNLMTMTVHTFVSVQETLKLLQAQPSIKTSQSSRASTVKTDLERGLDSLNLSLKKFEVGRFHCFFYSGPTITQSKSSATAIYSFYNNRFNVVVVDVHMRICYIYDDFSIVSMSKEKELFWTEEIFQRIPILFSRNLLFSDIIPSGESFMKMRISRNTVTETMSDINNSGIVCLIFLHAFINKATPNTKVPIDQIRKEVLDMNSGETLKGMIREIRKDIAEKLHQLDAPAQSKDFNFGVFFCTPSQDTDKIVRIPSLEFKYINHHTINPLLLAETKLSEQTRLQFIQYTKDTKKLITHLERMIQKHGKDKNKINLQKRMTTIIIREKIQLVFALLHLCTYEFCSSAEYVTDPTSRITKLKSALAYVKNITLVSGLDYIDNTQNTEDIDLLCMTYVFSISMQNDMFTKTTALALLQDTSKKYV